MRKTDRRTVVARTGRVALVILSTDSIETWAVRCPDSFGRLLYFTQSNEAAARDFYARVVAVTRRRP